MNGLLTIEGLDKISQKMVGFDYIVGRMITDRAFYRIFLNEAESGIHKRDLKLHRYPTRTKEGKYKLEWGSHHILLSKSDISDVDLFVSIIEKLIY